MAVRDYAEEDVTVSGTVSEWMAKSSSALTDGGFTKITSNEKLSQISANYNEMTVSGEIIVTLHPATELSVRINIKSTAKADNIWVLFSSPNKKIHSAFKEKLG